MNDSATVSGTQALIVTAALVALLGGVAFAMRRDRKGFNLFRVLGVALLGSLPLAIACWWTISNAKDPRNPYLLGATFLPIGLLLFWGIVATRKERMKAPLRLDIERVHQPSARTRLLALLSFFSLVLPAIWCSAMGYMWLLQRVLSVDIDANPETPVHGLILLIAVLPLIPVMVCSIYLAAIPWMFVMARTLSWEDIQFFTQQKGPRWPLLSDCAERLWSHAIRNRKPDGQRP